MALSSDDGAAPWPEAPGYSYSGLEARLPLLVGGAMITSSLFILTFAGLNALSASVPGALAGWDGAPVLSIFVIGRKGDIPSIAFVILTAYGALSVLGGAFMARYFARMRPSIALSDDGVFAYLKGKPWRFIGWREIASITRRTTFSKGGKPILTLLIKGPRHTIQVAGTIDRYPDLRERLMRYARDNHVPLQASVQGQGKASDVAEL
jgi:hypothetical protein